MTRQQSDAQIVSPAVDLGEDRRHPLEAPLFIACLAVSILACLPVLWVLVQIPIDRLPMVIGVLAFYGLTACFIFIAVGAVFAAHVRGNGLQVNSEQLPEVHRAVVRAAELIGTRLPEVYVVQFGRVRQGIAKIFLGSRMLVLSSSMIDENSSGPELVMMIGRELSHFRYGHIRWRYLLCPSMLLPLLYPAWRRATCYTADRCGLLACGDPAGAKRALFITASGAQLGRKVSEASYGRQLAEGGGFWMTLGHLNSAEPTVAWRAGELFGAIGGPQADTPKPPRSILATIFCAFTPAVFTAMGAAASAAGGAILVVAVIAMIPQVISAQAKSREIQDSVQLRNLVEAVRRYASENRGRIPFNSDALIHDGGVHRDDFRSRVTGNKIHYLPGEVIIRDGARYSPPIYDLRYDVVLFYCSHGSKVIAAFADGRVRAIPADEFHERIKPRSLKQLSR